MKISAGNRKKTDVTIVYYTTFFLLEHKIVKSDKNVVSPLKWSRTLVTHSDYSNKVK